MTRKDKIIFILVGGLSIAFGLFFAGQKMLFLRSAERTTGEIVEITQRESKSGRRSSRGIVYCPVAQFVVDGATYRHQGFCAGKTFMTWELQDSVPIAYNPQNPREASFATWYRLWLLPLFLIFFGLLWFLPFVLTEKRGWIVEKN